MANKKSSTDSSPTSMAKEAEKETRALKRKVRYNRSVGKIFSNLKEQLLGEQRSLDDGALLSDYNGVLDITIFPLPVETEDFDLPEAWKRLDSYVPYRSLKQNMYRFPLQRNICAPSSVPLCSCTVETGCDHNCTNRMLYMECGYGCCPTLIESADDDDPSSKYCSNMIVQSRNFPGVEVYKTDFCGYGLRVTEDLLAGSIIIEYLGEVITTSELMNRMAAYDESDAFYFASLESGLILDAKMMGSLARFANHSCDPTCELQKLNVLGEMRIVLVARQNLSSGTPLTYNYQYYDDGLDDVVDITRQVCHCGAENCSGTIGGRVTASESDVWKSKAQSLLSGRKRHPLEVFESHLDNIPGEKYRGCKEYCELECIVSIGSKLKDEIKSIFKYSYVRATAPEAIEVVDLHKPEEATSQEPALNEANSEERENVDWLVDIETAQAVLDKIPKAVKLDEAVKLSNFIKRAVHADRFMQSLREMLSSPVPKGKPTPAAVITSSSADTDLVNSSAVEGLDVQSIDDGGIIDQCSGEVKSLTTADVGVVSVETISFNQSLTAIAASTDSCDPSASVAAVAAAGSATALKVESVGRGHEPFHRISWEDLMYAFKEAFAAIPIKCKNIEFIMALYDELNSWARKHLKHVLHNRLFIDPPSNWNNVEKVFRFYHPFSSSSQKSDVFLLHDFLDNRYSKFMNRLRKKGLDIHSLEQVTAPAIDTFCDESEAVHCKLHCYCQMPEDFAEFHLLSQCDVCSDWFHPHCLNSSDLSAAALARNPTFTCSNCLLRRGLPNYFTLTPFSEWDAAPRSLRNLINQKAKLQDVTTTTIIAATSSSSQETDIPNHSTNILNEGLVEGRVEVELELEAPKEASKLDDLGLVGSENQQLDPIATATATVTETEDVVVEVEVEAIAIATSVTVPAPIRAVKTEVDAATTKPSRKPRVQNRKAKPAALVDRKKGIITPMEIEEALAAESSIRISENPVWLLLTLGSRYSLHWVNRAREFLNKQIVVSILSTTSNPTSPESSMVTKAWSNRDVINRNLSGISLFEEALFLYYELRVLRIYHLENEMLRRFVWRVSVDIYIMTNHPPQQPQQSQELCSLVNPHEAYIASGSSKTEVKAFKPKISDIEAAISGGLTIGCHPDCQAIQSLQEKQKCFSEVMEFVNCNSKCSGSHHYSTADVQHISSQLDYLLSVFDISPTDYNIVQAKAHIQGILRKLRLSLPSKAQDESSVTNQLISNSSEQNVSHSEVYDMDKATVIPEVFQAVEDHSQEQYCWCRQAENNLPMICCDSCEEWFHWQCVGIAHSVTKKKRKRRLKCEIAESLNKEREKGDPSLSNHTAPAVDGEVVKAAEQGTDFVGTLDLTADPTNAPMKKKSRRNKDAAEEVAPLVVPEELQEASYVCIYCSDVQQTPYNFKWLPITVDSS